MVNEPAHPYNPFIWRMFERIAAQHPSQNILISPLGIVSAIAMLHYGTGGESSKQIAQALSIEEFSQDDLDAINKLFHSSLKLAPDNRTLYSDDRVNLVYFSNSLWISDAFSPQSTFIDRASSLFEAEINHVDFDDPALPQQINRWIARKTWGEITHLVDSVSPQTIMMVLNTLILNLPWQNVFYKNSIKPHHFTKSDGTPIDTLMMSVSFTTSHFKIPTVEVIKIPYAGAAISMFVFLPASDGSLSEIRQRIPLDWQEWIQLLNKDEAYGYGSLVMPLFKFDFEIELSSILRDLNITDIFDYEHADFSKLVVNEPYPFINQFTHKTFINVDEQGTRAGFATSAWAVLGIDDKKFDMVVDRAFIFAIYDEKLGMPIFLGTVDNPS